MKNKKKEKEEERINEQINETYHNVSKNLSYKFTANIYRKEDQKIIDQKIKDNLSHDKLIRIYKLMYSLARVFCDAEFAKNRCLTNMSLLFINFIQMNKGLIIEVLGNENIPIVDTLDFKYACQQGRGWLLDTYRQMFEAIEKKSELKDVNKYVENRYRLLRRSKEKRLMNKAICENDYISISIGNGELRVIFYDKLVNMMKKFSNLHYDNNGIYFEMANDHSKYIFYYKSADFHESLHNFFKDLEKKNE